MPMARIAESEIERLKREISVQRLAEGRGVKLKRHGADLIGLVLGGTHNLVTDKQVRRLFAS
jgi:hypothetical protein